MSDLNLQDRLITSLINALASRRCAPSYSTSYHWNEHILLLAHELLDTANATLTTLLRRIIRNAEWFQSFYRASLSTLQQVQAHEAAVSKRQDLSRVFERDRGVRLDIGAMIDDQAERQEVELRTIERSRIGRGTALGSNPVGVPKGVERKTEEQQQQQQQPRRELEFRLTPPQDLVLKLETELQIEETLRAGRGTIVEGVDEDMILAFWAANVDR